MKIYHFKEITSTNDYARELLDKDEFICVTASNQLNGRGRNNNSWYGNYGNNLYISFGISHSEQCTLIKLAAYQAIGALAVKKALENLTGENIFRLKYPNDVYAKYLGEYKKISGVLVEHGFSGSNCTYSILGIGVNINEQTFPEQIKNNAVSLKLLGFNFTVEEVQNILIENFVILLDENIEDLYVLWKTELKIIEKEVKVINRNFNELFHAKEILEDGRLIVESNNNEEIIIDNGDSIRYNLD